MCLKCTSLTEISIPDNVTSIGSSAFSGCTNLNKIHFGKQVKSIDMNAFKENEKLETVYIPKNIESISSQAFINCPSLKTVILESSTPPTLSGVLVSTAYASQLKLIVPIDGLDTYQTETNWARYNSVAMVDTKYLDEQLNANSFDVQTDGKSIVEEVEQDGVIIKVANIPLANKVDKVEKGSKVLVYTNDDNSGQTTTHYLGNTNANYAPYNIPMIYGATGGGSAPVGYLITNTPAKDYHCANKKFVMENKGTQLYKHKATFGLTPLTFELECLSTRSTAYENLQELLDDVADIGLINSVEIYVYEDWEEWESLVCVDTIYNFRKIFDYESIGGFLYYATNKEGGNYWIEEMIGVEPYVLQLQTYAPIPL